MDLMPQLGSAPWDPDIVDMTSLPLWAAPDDPVVAYVDGIPELPIYQTRHGDRYQISYVPRQGGSRIKALGNALAHDPVGAAGDVVNVLAGSLWNGFTAPGRAAMGEPITYGDAIDTLGLITTGGISSSAPKGSIRSGIVGESYVRRNNNALSPDSGAGYSMFAKGAPDPDSDFLHQYGKYGWTVDDSSSVDVADIQKDIVRSLRRRGSQNDYGVPAASLARDAAPSDIVNGAGLWDEPALVAQVWEDVLEPRGIFKVRTPDGMIVFDPALAQRYLSIGGAALSAYGLSDHQEIRNYLAGL